VIGAFSAWPARAGQARAGLLCIDFEEMTAFAIAIISSSCTHDL